MTTAPPVLRELAESVRLFDEVRSARPLTTIRAWHQEDPDRTSQREALQQLAIYRTLLVFGGNRSGKTFLLLCVVVALALGSDHPDARAFWLYNGCDPDDFPRGPGRCWIVALTAPDSLEYHREQILALVPKLGPAHPKGTGGPVYHWNLRSKGDAVLEVMVPRHEKPAVIVFKADWPGPGRLQGSECRAVLHDEESIRWGRATWDQASRRLWDTNGYQLMSNTPIRGRTWVYDDFIERGEDGAVHRYIHSADNPWISKRRLRAVVAKAEDGDQAALAALFGVFVTLRGLVFPEWRRDRHVVEPFEIPDDWPKFSGNDFGLNNPTARVWATLSPDDVLVVYRVYSVAGPSYQEHADAIHELQGDVVTEDGCLALGRWDVGERRHVNGRRYALQGDDDLDGELEVLQGERVEASWGDPSAAQEGIPIYCERDLPTDLADRRVDTGLNEIRDRLRRGGGDMPRIVVFSTCRPLVKEIEGYIWNPALKNPRPLKVNDHLMDALRYLCMGVREYLGV